MIAGFEEYTKELTDYERDTLLPIIVRNMKGHVGRDNPIKNSHAVRIIKENGLKISEARFRKIMHVIRVSGMVKFIMATSDGYYIAETPDDLYGYRDSLDQRIKHITSLRNAIEKQAEELSLKCLDIT